VALDLVLDAQLHVVAEVVEAELGVRAVDDVAAVDRHALGRAHRRLDRAAGDAEVRVDRPHPLGVALRQVVVDRDQVHRLAREALR
jgi:hypothetical protein